MKQDALFLVIDDMATTSKLTSNLLTMKGFKNIMRASDGEEAWKILIDQYVKTKPVACVISDWNMPKLNGLDLLKKVRADIRFLTLPFIMLTNESEKMNLLTAVKSGVSAYFIKPVKTDELITKINALLGP
ncbi:MAG: response regulator [Oligoflexia bacterium]|nr:response regulator [Oligoflexia bacterium]